MWGGKKARQEQKKEDQRYANANRGGSIGGSGSYRGTEEDCLREIADRVSGYTGRFWRYSASVGYRSITVTVDTGGEDWDNYYSDIKHDIDNAVRRAARDVGCPFQFSYDIEII